MIGTEKFMYPQGMKGILVGPYNATEIGESDVVWGVASDWRKPDAVVMVYADRTGGWIPDAAGRKAADFGGDAETALRSVIRAAIQPAITAGIIEKLFSEMTVEWYALTLRFWPVRPAADE